MTEQQQKWIKELSECTFYPGSFDKRFVRHAQSWDAEKELTEKQADFLEKLAWRYRRQRGDEQMSRPTGEIDARDVAKLLDWNEGKPLR